MWLGSVEDGTASYEHIAPPRDDPGRVIGPYTPVDLNEVIAAEGFPPATQ